MEAKLRPGNKLLYPMLITAAISVIVFSLVGIATMTGVMPSALSKNAAIAEVAAKSPSAQAAKTAAACLACGVIESIRSAQVQGQGTGLGAVTGGVLGALAGRQFGHGSGNTAMTVIGAGGGAYAGNEVEKNMKSSIRYQIRVRMDDGTYHTFYEAVQPAWRVGDKVKVINGSLSVAG